MHSISTVSNYESSPTSYIAMAQGGNPADYAVRIKALGDVVTVTKDTSALIKIIDNDDYLSDGGAISISLADASWGRYFDSITRLHPERRYLVKT